MGGAAAMNPYVQGGLMAANAATDIIGMILQMQAMEDAGIKSERMDERNFQYQQKRDRFSDKMAKEGLALQKENLAIAKDQNQLAKNRFALDATQTGYGIVENQAKKVVDLLNADNSLRDRVLRNWSI